MNRGQSNIFIYLTLPIILIAATAFFVFYEPESIGSEWSSLEWQLQKKLSTMEYTHKSVRTSFESIDGKLNSTQRYRLMESLTTENELINDIQKLLARQKMILNKGSSKQTNIKSNEMMSEAIAHYSRYNLFLSESAQSLGRGEGDLNSLANETSLQIIQTLDDISDLQQNIRKINQKRLNKH